MVCFVLLGFIVVDEIMVLMCEVVVSGELDVLVFECVWQELCKVLVSEWFFVFLCMLYDVYVLGLILFELEVLYGVLQCVEFYFEVDIGIYQEMVSDMVVKLVFGDDLVGFVVFIYDFGKGLILLEEWLCYIMYEQCGIKLLKVLCV